MKNCPKKHYELHSLRKMMLKKKFKQLLERDHEKQASAKYFKTSLMALGRNKTGNLQGVGEI